MPDQAADTKVYMLNVLWFKPNGGAETYGRYAKAVAPLLAEHGATLPELSYQPEMAIIGEWDADLLFVVEWPSWQAFQAMATSERYRVEAGPLREAAIEKSLLIRCNAMPLAKKP